MGTRLHFNLYYSTTSSSVMRPLYVPTVEQSAALTKGGWSQSTYALWESNYQYSYQTIYPKTYPTDGPYPYPGNHTYFNYEYYGILNWVSDPVASQVTISGPITFNIWSWTGNSGLSGLSWRALIRKVALDGTVTTVVDALSAEIGNSVPTTALNWTVTPDAFTLNKGEYLLATIHSDDAPGKTGLTYRGVYTRMGTSYPTYLEFTESLTFYSYAPTQTTTNLLSTASDLSGKKKLWTDAATTPTEYTVNTVNQPDMAQWTSTAGGSVVEWITPMLQNTTVEGHVLLNFYGRESSYLANVSPYIEIYKTDADGNSPVLIGDARQTIELGTSNSIAQSTIYGRVYGQIALTDRILIRAYTTSANNAAQISGYTAVLKVEQGSTLNTRIQWPTALTEFVGSVLTIPTVVVEVSVPVDTDTFYPAALLTANAVINPYATSSTAHTGAFSAGGVMTIGSTITGGNATASLTATANFGQVVDVFTKTSKVVANFGADNPAADFTKYPNTGYPPDYKAYPDTEYPGYPPGTVFGEIKRNYSDLLDLTDHSQANGKYPTSGWFAGPAFPPVGTCRISPTRHIVWWTQGSAWQYDLPDNEPRFYVALVDTSNSREPKMLDRIYQGGWTDDWTQYFEYAGDNVNPLILPDGDIVVTMTASLYTTVGGEGAGNNLMPVARVHLNDDGNSISFAWCKGWGHPTISTEYGFNYTTHYWDGHIYVLAGNSNGNSSMRDTYCIKVDPDTGSYLSYNDQVTTIERTSQLYYVFPSGNFYLGDDGGGYYKGHLSTMTLNGGAATPTHYQMPDWIYNNIYHEWDGSHYPVRDYKDNSYLRMIRWWSAPSAYFYLARYDEVDGGLTITEMYTTDELMEPQTNWNNYTTATKGGFWTAEEDWVGQNNYFFPMAHPGGKISFYGQSEALMKLPAWTEFWPHQGGPQVSYDMQKATWDAENEVFSDPLPDKQWDSVAYAGNWVDLHGWDADWNYGYYRDWWPTAYPINDTKIGLAWACGNGAYFNNPYVGGGIVYFCTYDAGGIPPPLKMTQRDDDKKTGAKRLGYDSVNSRDIRLGTVAW